MISGLRGNFGREPSPGFAGSILISPSKIGEDFLNPALLDWFPSSEVGFEDFAFHGNSCEVPSGDMSKGGKQRPLELSGVPFWLHLRARMGLSLQIWGPPKQWFCFWLPLIVTSPQKKNTTQTRKEFKKDHILKLRHTHICELLDSRDPF